MGVLVLGGLALAGGGRGGRLSLAGAAFFLLAALGRHTAVYRVLSLVPGFTLMRYPQKHLLPFALCAALAAGFGAVTWASEWSVAARRRGRWIAWAVIGLGAGLLATAARMRVGVPLLATVLEDPAQIVPVSVSASLSVLRTAVLVVALGVLLRWRSGRAAGPGFGRRALVTLAGLDLVAVGRTVNPLAPPELATHRPALADTLVRTRRARGSTSSSGPAAVASAAAPRAGILLAFGACRRRRRPAALRGALGPLRFVRRAVPGLEPRGRCRS